MPCSSASMCQCRPMVGLRIACPGTSTWPRLQACSAWAGTPFQPATPTTRTRRTISGQLVSQIHSPIITGRNSTQTTTAGRSAASRGCLPCTVEAAASRSVRPRKAIHMMAKMPRGRRSRRARPRYSRGRWRRFRSIAPSDHSSELTRLALQVHGRSRVCLPSNSSREGRIGECQTPPCSRRLMWHAGAPDPRPSTADRARPERVALLPRVDRSGAATISRMVGPS